MAGLLNQSADIAATNSPAASPVKRGTPLYEQIYDALWDLIFKGEIESGQRLSDREWANRLSTSRTPVREAMRQMARDGVLIVLENGGYQVRTVDPHGLANLYSCRAPLAALAVYDTALAADDMVLKQVRDVVEAAAKAIANRDAEHALRLNSNFHNLVVENCGNPYLITMMTNLERLILFYRIALLKTSLGERAQADEYFRHLARGNKRQVQVAQAMAQRDGDRAKSLMEQHLLASADDMARILRQS
jgi:DNA-binding GntR family transcriptional regulator